MKKLLQLIVCLSLATLAGCTQSRQSTPGAEGPNGVFKTADAYTLATTEYRVAPPDHLKVKAPSIKELDSASDVEIRADGKITLNLLGEVYVAGKTPEEIGKLLTTMATKYYINPDVKVEVTQYKSKTFQMFGMLNTPGSKPFTGNNTVLKALADAGFNDDAWPQQVYVSRPKHLPEQPQDATAIVDLKHMYETGDLAQNYLLKEGDIIDVPLSPLSAMNVNMTKVLGPITGAAGGVGAGATIAHPNNPGGN